MPLVSSTIFGHEFLARKLALLHQAELMFPFTGHRRAGDIGRLHGGEELDELLRFGSWHQLTLIPMHILLVNEAIDYVRARGRRAETALLHCFGQLFVLDYFPAVSIAESSVASV